MIEIVETTPGHLEEIRDTLQDDDRREISGFGVTPQKALWRSYKRSAMRRTAMIDGAVGAVWGCAGQGFGYLGVPWLLTSRHVRRISPLKFTRLYQLQVMEMLGMYPRLENFVLSDYEEAVRLLSIVGFKIGEPEKIRNGLYRRFSLEAA